MLPIKTVLHPTDFSECSDLAFRLACALARDYGARLIVLNVMEPVTAVSPQGKALLAHERASQAAYEHLEERRSRDPNLHVEHRQAQGDSAQEILRVAKVTAADVIVMGTHGRTGLNRLIMGSVAERVLREAPCPVLTVKMPSPAGVNCKESKSMANGGGRMDLSGLTPCCGGYRDIRSKDGDND